MTRIYPIQPYIAFRAITALSVDGFARKFRELEEVPSCIRQVQECKQLYKSFICRVFVETTDRYPVVCLLSRIQISSIMHTAQKWFYSLDLFDDVIINYSDDIIT